MKKTVPFLALWLWICFTVNAQELEPRALTNLPIGTNFIVAGYTYANGNILFDPALPLDDTQAQVNTFVTAYLRSINLFGLSGKINIVLPYGTGEWTGVYTGIDTETSRSGFGDVRVRLSINFVGAPALKMEEFNSYEPHNISGFSLQVIAPTGQYFPDRLINLGSNRWTFKPQWGYAINFNKWILETNLSARFYTKNTDFWGGNELKQNPMAAIKIHTIWKLPKRMWVATSAGYAWGATSTINNIERDSKISTIRFALTYAVPLGEHHSLRVIGFSGIRLKKGADFDSVSLLYQYTWNNSQH